jgi:hypothetical protein
MEQIHVLAGSSMRRMVPETQAAVRGMMNSKPSLETSVTNSDFGMSAMLEMCSRVLASMAKLKNRKAARGNL